MIWLSRGPYASDRLRQTWTFSHIGSVAHEVLTIRIRHLSPSLLPDPRRGESRVSFPLTRLARAKPISNIESRRMHMIRFHGGGLGIPRIPVTPAAQSQRARARIAVTGSHRTPGGIGTPAETPRKGWCKSGSTYARRAPFREDMRCPWLYKREVARG